MCGLSAIISKDLKKIHAMNDLIKHRGPDAESFHFGEGFALGHRRLSIIDLSNDGVQPMSSLASGNVIIFNGEIYNYLEIKKELEGKGRIFHTKTDTEVILQAFEEWGETCVERFNGMWAFVIFVKASNQLFISRDRFGVKPLYIFQNKEIIALGSEIKQLLQFTQKKVNMKYMTNFLVTGLLDYNDETFFAEIKKIPASCNVTIDLTDRKISSYQYFDIHERSANGFSFETALEGFENLFRSSISLRLRSDVKVGTCLSGGLDSSAVASVASELHTGKVKFQGVFAKSTEIQTDESKYANMVAEHTNLELNQISPSYKDFSDNIEEVIYTQEEPFVSPSIFMQYFVMKKASEIGCKVMLDGQGGDETLLGYEKYYSASLYETFRKKGARKFFEQVTAAKTNNTKLTPLTLLKYFIGMVSWRLRLTAHCFQARMLKPEFLFNDYSFLRMLSGSVTKSAFALQKYEINHTNLPSLLRYEDKNSMRHSVEARLPFLDYRLVEYGLNLPAEFKINEGWSKFILRKFLGKRLPAEVVWRKNKLGFNAPEQTWIQEHQAIMKNEISNSNLLKHISTSKIHEVKPSNGGIFWRLYNVAVWERVYGVKF